MALRDSRDDVSTAPDLATEVTESTDAHERLASLRRELDSVDHRLRDALRARLDVCEEIGRLKRDHDIAVMQPARVGEVTRGARDFAERNGMSPDYLESLYELIIAETCRVEDTLVASDADRHPRADTA